jgi:hypothetical protein
VMHRSESVSIISEAQRKFTVNFSSLHFSEEHKFDNCILFEFYSE